jgi:hypothetical protein
VYVTIQRLDSFLISGVKIKRTENTKSTKSLSPPPRDDGRERDTKNKSGFFIFILCRHVCALPLCIYYLAMIAAFYYVRTCTFLSPE